jgi:hypothetical protein
MKRELFLTGIILCFFSCTLDEEKGYYSDSFGVVKLSSKNTPYIKSDEGEMLIPDESISSFVSSGDRVWVSYLVKKENINQDTLTISPYRITGIMPLKIQNATNLKNDGIDLWTVWVAQDFLTFDFRVRAKDTDKLKDHEYALVSPQKEITDTLFIDFVHDAGNDTDGILCRTAVTLKLNELKIANDSIVLAVDYRNLDGVKQQTEYRIYKKSNK